MKSSSKVVIVLFVIGMSIFGYSQYASASQIGVIITQSHVLEENDAGSTYDVELQFNNPSLLVLTAGETEFYVITDDDIIGEGTLDSFILPALGSSLVNGIFHTDPGVDSEEIESVKISGTTKYDLFLTTIDVPFIFYPTEDQAREFIHQK